MRFFLFVFSSLYLLSAYSQKIKVQDYDSKKLLQFVTIVGYPSQQSVITNADGFVDVGILKSDDYLLFQMMGYQRLKINFKKLHEGINVISIEKSYFDVGEVVVSATRWKQQRRDVPQKISSISSKDFQLLNPQTAADLLSTSDDVYIQKSQQGGGSPMIRGFSTNRLLYTVDGVRMNNAIFRSGNLQNVISLDAFAMDNVEVLFGPGAIIYGSDAIGGVISFNTKNPPLSSDSAVLFAGSAVLRGATANEEQSFHVDLSIGGKKWGFLSSFSRSEYNDLRMGKNGPDDYLRDSLIVTQNGQDFIAQNGANLVQRPSAFSQINLMQKVLFQPNEKWLFKYGFHFSETSEYGRYDRLTQKRNGTLRFAEWNYGPQKWQMHHLDAELNKKTMLFDRAKLNIAFQLFEESRIDRNRNSSNRRTRTEKVNAYSANLDFNKKVGGGHELFYGVESVVNQVTSEGFSTNILTMQKQDIQTRYPDALWLSNAIYLTDNIQINEKLSVDAGVRLSQFAMNADFDQTFIQLPFQKIKLNKAALNGSLGMLFRPIDSWVLSANLSTGYRAPNVDDMGKIFDSEDFAVVVPNDNLTAEYAYNAELSASKTFGSVWEFDVTGFYTFLNNALVRRNTSLNGNDSLFFDGGLKRVQSIQNAAFAEVYGLQTGVEIRITKQIKFENKLNFQKGTEELEDGSTSPSRHVAPLFTISRLSYKKEKFQLQASFIYNHQINYENLNVGEQEKAYLYAADENGLPYSPAWYTFNINAQYQVNKYILFTLGVENITDQLYRPYSSGISGAGRNIVGSIIANF
ncbi:MAG: hemoglobin/transferrin/lactoferrin receptor protein [Vicingaceae bacterium]|jgi:hemoglobin/transferrin/lactoferrin receptor protein